MTRKKERETTCAPVLAEILIDLFGRLYIYIDSKFRQDISASIRGCRQDVVTEHDLSTAIIRVTSETSFSTTWHRCGKQVRYL